MKVCWNITSRCNKNCNYCFKFSKKELSLEENKKILNKLKRLGVKRISWSGGEPFLYENLIELLKLSKEYGITNFINTNASVLDYAILKKCINYIDRFIISLDFVDDKLNSKYGIGENLFNVKLPFEVNDYYLKEYVQLHGDVDEDGNIIPMPSYGYHLISGKDNFFYSGDTCSINDVILEKFKNNEIKYLYQEISTDGYKAHLQLDELVNLFDLEDRNRIICMHLGDFVDTTKIKKLGFRSVR